MSLKEDTTKKKPLLPIRFTGLFGKREVMQRVEPTPEPSKVEAPRQPTPMPEATGRVYGRVSTPETNTKGIEDYKKKV